MGGVGGTVAATILQAETLAAHGWQVLVASPIARDFVFNGVRYAPLKVANGAQHDVMLLVNTWADLVARVKSHRKVFLYHDTRPGGGRDTAQCVDWADTAVVDSPFSITCLAPGLSADAARKVVAMPLPIRIQDYSIPGMKPGNRLLYSSMPDRGLVHLARVFPAIRNQVPDAELHITGDFSMYGWTGAKTQYEKLFAGTPGVFYHGHVDRTTLVELQSSAKVLAFPCTFPEGFCIAAAEAMAAGAVPVTSNAFALSTTVGSAGVLIPGHPGGGRRRVFQRWLYLRRFVRQVVRLLTDSQYWSQKSAACRDSASSRFSGKAWYEVFRPLVA